MRGEGGYHAGMTTVSPRALPGTSATDSWTTVDATELYEIDRWGAGYFSVGDNGNVLVHPTKDTARSIDLKQLIDRLQKYGVKILDLPDNLTPWAQVYCCDPDGNIIEFNVER